MSFFDYQNYYLVGIKGVAMTSLAQLLLDAGKKVSGSDVPEAFVTEKILSTLPVQIDTSFDKNILEETQCVIYTAAHQGKFHPQVKQAQAKNIAVYSHAEALSFFFNEKKGIAVCGVGGKSTVSAMISWILENWQQTRSQSALAI
jgi:UDP-N-acetylmuramate--alanine ligase